MRRETTQLLFFIEYFFVWDCFAVEVEKYGYVLKHRFLSFRRGNRTKRRLGTKFGKVR
jgi:hypothetical protein